MAADTEIPRDANSYIIDLNVRVTVMQRGCTPEEQTRLTHEAGRAYEEMLLALVAGVEELNPPWLSAEKLNRTLRGLTEVIRSGQLVALIGAKGEGHGG